jgi:DNA-binding CsgD family transcriptional regulator
VCHEDLPEATRNALRNGAFEECATRCTACSDVHGALRDVWHAPHPASPNFRKILNGPPRALVRGMTGSDKLISIAEAAYRLDLDDQAWLAHLARNIAELLPQGTFQLAFSYRASGSGFELCDVLERQETGLFTPSTDGARRVPHGNGELALRCLSHTLCSTLSILDAGLHATWARELVTDADADLLLMTARDGTPVGVGFAVGFPAKRRPTTSARRTWERIAAHVTAALRIRTELCRELPSVGTVPRDQLRELCRSETSAYPNDAFDGSELWRELSQGRYSLLEHFDQQDRHYFVLRRQSDGSFDPRALTEREAEILELAAHGDTDRTIAGRLALSNSTVATHRARGMEKLGIKSRALLGHLLRQLRPGPVLQPLAEGSGVFQLGGPTHA